MKLKTTLAALTATTLSGVSVPTTAADVAGVDFNGYFRAGAGQNATSGRSSCFQLEGAATKYRLGNECDAYGEFLLSKDAWVAQDGAKFKVNFMPTLYSGNQTGDSFSSPSYDVAQLYVEGRDIPELGDAKVWAGRRFYQREVLHIADFWYQNASGTGAGIEGVRLGGTGKANFSYAFFRDNGANSKEGRSRHYFSVRDIGLYEGGALNLAAQFIAKDRASVTGPNNSGASLFVQHVHTLGDLGTNKLNLQYGTGPSVTPSGFGGNFTAAWFGPAGPASYGSDVKRARVVDDLSVQVNPSLGGQLMAVYQRDKIPGADLSWMSLGGRISYAFTNHTKLLVEAGNDTVRPSGGSSRSLTKFTIAPAFSADRGFWSRPELRLFYTYARWDQAAQAAADATNPGSALSSTGVFGNTTHGANFGVQAEAWW
jgi:maltoporin